MIPNNHLTKIRLLLPLMVILGLFKDSSPKKIVRKNIFRQFVGLYKQRILDAKKRRMMRGIKFQDQTAIEKRSWLTNWYYSDKKLPSRIRILRRRPFKYWYVSAWYRSHKKLIAIVVISLILSSMGLYWVGIVGLAYTSQANGSWDDPLTWVGGVPLGPVPGNGDTATIAHNVYSPTSITIGTGVAGSASVTINDLATWTIGPSHLGAMTSPITITVKGQIQIQKRGNFYAQASGANVCTISESNNNETLFSHINVGTNSLTTTYGIFFYGTSGGYNIVTSTAGNTLSIFYINPGAGSDTQYNVRLDYVSFTPTYLGYVLRSRVNAAYDYFDCSYLDFSGTINTLSFFYHSENTNNYHYFYFDNFSYNTLGSSVINFFMNNASRIYNSTMTNVNFNCNGYGNAVVVLNTVTTNVLCVFTNVKFINTTTSPCIYFNFNTSSSTPTVKMYTFINCSYSSTGDYYWGSTYNNYWCEDYNSNLIPSKIYFPNGSGFVYIYKTLGMTVYDAGGTALQSVDVIAISGEQNPSTNLPYASCGDVTLNTGKLNTIYLAYAYVDKNGTTYYSTNANKANIVYAKSGYNQYLSDGASTWASLGTPQLNQMDTNYGQHYIQKVAWDGGSKSTVSGTKDIESNIDNLSMGESLALANKFGDSFNYIDADASNWKWYVGLKRGDGTTASETGTTSGDIGITTPGAMRGSALYSGGTAGKFYRTMDVKLTNALTEVIIRIDGSVSDSTDAIFLGLYPNSINYTEMGRIYNSGSSRIYMYRAGSGTYNYADSADNHIWLKLILGSGPTQYVYYNTDDTLIPPTSWTLLNFFGSYGGTNNYITLGIRDSAATGSAVTADFSYFSIRYGLSFNSVFAGEIPFYTSGNATSALQDYVKSIDSMNIFMGYADANNYVDKIEILNSSDTVVSTYTGNITTTGLTTLTSANFDNGLTLNATYKVKVYLVGDGAKSPIISYIQNVCDAPIYLRYSPLGGGANKIWGHQMMLNS